MSGHAMAHGGPGAAADGRKLPPIAELSMLTLALIAAGGIFMASYIPRRAPLGVPIALAAVASVVVVVNVVSMLRIRPFAWSTFTLVAKWVALAYVIEMGMLLYVFIYDDTPGGQLAVLAWMLVLFAIDVPLVVAFTVARYA